MSRVRSQILVASATVLQLGSTAMSAGAQTAQLAGAAIKPPISAAAARLYGPEVTLGNGRARTYVVLDEQTKKPLEIGVALDEKALDGLPAAGSGHHGSGPMVHSSILSFPKANGTPFQFLELNWNPAGHEPEGVYQDFPHFDFHFYTISRAERDEIVPTNPTWEASANDVPIGEYVPAFNVALAPPGASPAQIAVPMMGVHWLDTRSPELQRMLGRPEAYKPFTATFLYGSWKGRLTFWEPMITRTFILEKKTATEAAIRDQTIPVSVPVRFKAPGFYPDAYRITWDADAKEYRIALTNLAWRS